MKCQQMMPRDAEMAAEHWPCAQDIERMASTAPATLDDSANLGDTISLVSR